MNSLIATKKTNKGYFLVLAGFWSLRNWTKWFCLEFQTPGLDLYQIQRNLKFP